MVSVAVEIQVECLDCICQRCGHRWDAVGPDAPSECAKCHSAAWLTAPPGEVAAKKPAVSMLVDGIDCHCQRCGHRWVVIGRSVPAQCRGCHSVYWLLSRDAARPGWLE